MGMDHQEPHTKRGRSAAIQEPLPELFYNELAALLKENGLRASRSNKVVSHETRDGRGDLLILAMRELRGLGYRLRSPHNLEQRHVKALVGYWEECELKPATIANRISSLRVLAKWIGKPNMIGRSTDFAKHPESVRRSQISTEDKSWSAVGLDVDAMIGLVEQFDERVGLQMRLMRGFGLRRKEAVMFRPHMADMGIAIRVREGTKGGRERVVPVETKAQRDLLDFAKTKVKNIQGHIGHPDKNLEQAIRRFTYVMERFGITKHALGVTSHGLRHQHLNDLYEEVAGAPSPVRDGSLSQALDKLTHDIARARVSQEAGHSRLGITAAYIGSRNSQIAKAEQEKLKRIRELIAQDNVSESEGQEVIRLLKELQSKAEHENGHRP